VPLTLDAAVTGTVGVGGAAAFFSSQTNSYLTGAAGGNTSVNRGNSWSYESQGGSVGTKFDSTNTNGVLGGGNSTNSGGFTVVGGTGFGSDYTQYYGGGGAGTNGVGGNYNASAAPGVPAVGGAPYVFEGLVYGGGGGGAKFILNGETHTKGSSWSNANGAGGGGGGAIGGTYKKTGRTLIYNLPLADPGQNGRVKIWVRAT
jgi:hypothetical protein